MSASYVIFNASQSSSNVSTTFNGRGELEYLTAKLVTTATVGNRQMELRVKDAKGNVLFSMPAGAVQTAGLTRTYIFMPGAGATRETAFVGNAIIVPIPFELTIPNSGVVQLIDTAAVDAAADALTISYQFEPDDD